MTTWTDYMRMAARHSRYNAAHWFRYLRKDIDKCGTLFSAKDVEKLCNDNHLTLFQRVTLKAAFQDGTGTRRHIRNLNRKVEPKMLAEVRRKYGN